MRSVYYTTHSGARGDQNLEAAHGQNGDGCHAEAPDVVMKEASLEFFRIRKEENKAISFTPLLDLEFGSRESARANSKGEGGGL